MGVNAYNDRHNRLLILGTALVLLVVAVKLWSERRKSEPARPDPPPAFPVDSAPNGQNVPPSSSAGSDPRR